MPPGNTDGTQNPAGLLKYACVTDATGNITMGAQAGGNEWGVTKTCAPMFLAGTFESADLPQTGTGVLDAAGLAKMNGHIISGALPASAIIRIG